jgi:ABC-2 type transport system ATP-binding protein
VILNKSIHEIGKKLAFKNPVNISEALYFENGIQGANGISLNTGQEDSRVDIELLFNAVIHKPSIFEILN